MPTKDFIAQFQSSELGHQSLDGQYYHFGFIRQDSLIQLYERVTTVLRQGCTLSRQVEDMVKRL